MSETLLTTSPMMDEARERIAPYIDIETPVPVQEIVADNPEEAALRQQLSDVRIVERRPIITPRQLETAVPLSVASMRSTLAGRQAAADILLGNDDRMMLQVGPCSIHNPEAAMRYGRFIGELQEEYDNELLFVMRAYFEKPRTTVGWKGMLPDPEMNGSHNVNLGLAISRLILVRLGEMEVPTITERLDTGTPQFHDSLTTIEVIGARNAEDQNARAYASGSSSIIAIKNSTDGNIMAAVNGVESANAPHHFLGIDADGRQTQQETTGNPLAHIILRGGTDGPNYSPEHVERALGMLKNKGRLGRLTIDASHANSGKKAANQLVVAASVAEQVANGQRGIVAIMAESNIKGGKQDLDKTPLSEIDPEMSVTDECIDLASTREMAHMLASAVRQRRKQSKSSVDSIWNGAVNSSLHDGHL